jgi:hypothetical protein
MDEGFQVKRMKNPSGAGAIVLLSSGGVGMDVDTR